MTMGMEAMNEEQPDVAVMDMSMACAWNDVKVPSSDKTDAGDTIYLHKHMYARINKMQVHMNGEHIVNELPVGLEFLEEDWYPEMKREFYNFSPGRLKAYV